MSEGNLAIESINWKSKSCLNHELEHTIDKLLIKVVRKWCYVLYLIPNFKVVEHLNVKFLD
jgi:hypothetical protein